MSLKILSFDEVTDNWGGVFFCEEPDEIYRILNSPDEWSDDFTFHGVGDRMFSLDDLIGQEVEVEGFPIFTVPKDKH